jgi:transposase
MRAYSIDLRERIFEDCDGGMTTRLVALKYRVSESWVRRLKQRRRETGEVAPRRLGRKKPAAWLEYADELRSSVEQQPDITLRELQAKLGRPVSIQTLSRALRALQLTFKKKSSARRNKIGRTSGSGGWPGKPK